MRRSKMSDKLCPYCGGDISLKLYGVISEDIYPIRSTAVESATRIVCPYCEKKITMYQQYVLDKVMVLKR